jgi:acyl-CoA thioester hydrolase
MEARYSHRLRPRYAECDQQGVVFNAHYFAYFDVVMTEVWRDSGIPYGEMIAAGTDVVVAEASARFHAPARFDEEIDLEWWITRLGNTGMTSRVDVKRAGELLVEGELRHVFMDMEAGAKRSIPDDIRRALGAYVDESVSEESDAKARA